LKTSAFNCLFHHFGLQETTESFKEDSMSKMARISFKVLDLLIIFVLTFGSPMSALAHVWTDPTDYPPGSTVWIQGNNDDDMLQEDGSPWDYLEGETVDVQVDGPGDWASSCSATVDATGYWTCSIQLDSDPAIAVGEYTFTATGLVSGKSETGMFTDANQSADLDQCANDPFPSPSSNGCNASANPSPWVNGNLGESKAVYFEGDSIAYRMRFGDLTAGAHTVTIEWDTTKSGKHAIDYLTTFNRTVLDANPCLDVSGCTYPGTPSTFPIPADPQVTGAGVTPVAGDFTLYGGTITGVGVSPYYSYADGAGFAGDKSARITISFTTSIANPVLAWGGHIATRADWGPGNSAVAISHAID
jgi:hypothetical protein